MMGVSLALTVLSYVEGRSDARTDRRQRLDDFPRASLGQKLCIARRALVVVCCLISVVILGQLVSARVCGVATSLVLLTQSWGVLGLWAPSKPTSPRRTECSAAWQ